MMGHYSKFCTVCTRTNEPALEIATGLPLTQHKGHRGHRGHRRPPNGSGYGHGTKRPAWHKHGATQIYHLLKTRSERMPMGWVMGCR